MLSLKQIGTICFLTIFFISPTFADNETPSYITNASNCNQGVLHTTSAPAALEANYSANRINTTWYSNGTALSGNGVPSSCTYDSALLPPTPDARPGYTFGGWRVHVAAPVVPTLDSVNTNSPVISFTTMGYDWEVTFDYGVVSGHSGCVPGYPYGEEVGSVFDEDVPGGMPGDTCGCQIDSFTPTNGTEQIAVTGTKGIVGGIGDMMTCQYECANWCEDNIRNYASFRSAMYQVTQFE